MRPDIIKSKTDPKKYLTAFVIIAILLLLNLISWNKLYYNEMDTIFNPFLISTKNSSSNVALFWKEFTNKSFITAENMELKRQITEYDEIKVQNEDLKEQVKRLTEQTKIQSNTERKLKLLKISGVQNLYSINPLVKAEINTTYDPEIGTPIFYNSNTLFGFVNSISGRTANIVPFYSPNILFSISVQDLKDPTIKGFINKIDNGSITIRNIPKSASVGIGDIWITTNDVAELPSGVIIGKVKAVRDDTSTGFKEIEIDLPYNLAETNYLFIEIK